MYSFTGGLCVDHENHEYYVNGDTIVNTEVFKKIYFNYTHFQYVFNCTNYTNPCLCCQYACNPLVETSKYAGGLRGDSGRIYFLPPSESKDTLLYDFTLNVGDTLPTSYIYDPAMLGLRVSRIDTVLIGTQYRKKFILSPFQAGCFLGDTATWMIEGIGHRQGLLEPMFCVFEIGCGIDCYSELGKTVFPDSSAWCSFTIGVAEQAKEEINFAVFPNPVHNKLGVRWDNNSVQEITLLNTLGEKIYAEDVNHRSVLSIEVGNLPSGMYLLQARTKNGLLMKKILKQ